MSAETSAEKRQAMIETQLVARGIHDPAVLAAMRAVLREAFVPPEWVADAYEDRPLPIAQGQTISQPYIVALMAQALLLTPHDRVLEIGTGSGYSAAVLGHIVAEVHTVERLESLASTTRDRLYQLGYHNISVHHGDGTLGWPPYAPYNGIVVTAAGPAIPAALREQLAIGGRLVIPVGKSSRCQRLVRVIRQSLTQFEQEALTGVRFVPLIGVQGWSEHEAAAPDRGPESQANDSP